MSLSTRRWTPACPRPGRDDGNAIVEFLALGVTLLVPLLYLVAVLSQLQAASYAVEAAARDGARTVARAGDERQAEAALGHVVRLALDDQGLGRPGRPQASTRIECSARPCLQPESRISVTVRIDVVLPGVPALVDQVVPTRIPVTATGHSVVGRFAPAAQGSEVPDD